MDNSNRVVREAKATNEESYAIVLPCSQEDFKDFISGLLGKPETIEKSLFGTFEITAHDVENTFHLLDQRIHQQNEATLIQFTIKLVYSDGSAITLSSLDDFLRYTEIRPLISVAVHLSWVYLIKFQDKQFPEKQQIQMSMIASPVIRRRLIESDHVILHGDLDFDSHIKIIINHTARTWGIDIESLLTGHVNTILKTENKYKQFIYEKSGLIGFISGSLLIILALVGAYFGQNKFVESQLGSAQVLMTSAANDAEKLNYLIESAIKGPWVRYQYAQLIFIIVSFVLAVSMGVWVSSTADNRPRSFIRLSKKAEEVRDRYLEKRKRRWLVFVISLVVSILTGVISNYIFAALYSR